MVAMGLMESPLGLLALPGAVLIGFAFGSVGMAATTFMKSWQDFDLVNLVTLPLFLFSATFYPLEVYPEAIQYFTRISPLYHGAELLRGSRPDRPEGRAMVPGRSWPASNGARITTPQSPRR